MIVGLLVYVSSVCDSTLAQESNVASNDRLRIIAETMQPYTGDSVKGVDPSTLTGKVMCGYQGWHAAEGDGCGRGWYHWQGRQGFAPGSTNVDLWPDVSELDADERFATAFKKADGSAAEVYSAFVEKTVLRHFQWMKEYGIDGAFVQRFGAEVSHLSGLRQFTTVLKHCRKGANMHGRTYAVMYDLSGLNRGQVQNVADDWKLLLDKMEITRDPAYLHHHGKPVVAVWGIGFNDNRKYTLEECRDLIAFLKSDRGGACTVMIGVPTYWRTLDRDAVKDTVLLDIISQADIVSPWTVGRYRNPSEAAQYANQTLTADIQWCNEHHIELMPVVFPGFSWHNQNPKAATNQIPRLQGQFLWSQFAQAKRAGAAMVYQAMFDEVDEATAIFKCTNDVPIGASTFLTYEGLPSDHYLKLVGKATEMFRSHTPMNDTMPDLSHPK